MKSKSIEKHELDLIRALRKEIYTTMRLERHGLIDADERKKRLNRVMATVRMLEAKYGLEDVNGKR